MKNINVVLIKLGLLVPLFLLGGIKGLAGTTIQVGSSTASPGSTVNVPITLAAQGNENALGFSLSYDPALLSFQQAVKGSGAANATLIVNSNQVSNGRLGFQIGQPAGSAFAGGTQALVVVSFRAAAVSSTTSAPIRFGDQPVQREVVDVNVNTIVPTYLDGAITINATVSYTVTPIAGTNGTISPATPQGVVKGGSITFTAMAANGYTVDQWWVIPAGVFPYLADSGGSNITLTNVTADTSVQVSFKPAVVAPQITHQPQNQSVVGGDGASFTVVASGTPAPTYQWQVSMDGGVNWASLNSVSPYSGTASSTLSVIGVTSSMNNYEFRAVASNGVNPNAASTPAILTVRPSFAVYSADAATTPFGTARLYLNTAETQIAPNGSLLWFVADTTGFGIGSITGSVPLATLQEIAGGTGSLQLIASATTPGNLGGFAAPGAAAFSFANVSMSYASNNIYAMLFDDVNHNGAPDAGETFGVYKIGVAPPPRLGNAQWLISQNMHADQNAVVSGAAVGALTVNVVPGSSFQAGFNGSVIIAMTTVNPIPSGGRIQVTFPPGYVVASVAGMTATGLRGLAGAWTATVSGQVVTLTQAPNAASTMPGPKSLMLGGVINPPLSGVTGAFNVSTMDASGKVIDAGSAPGVTIQAGILSSPSVTPSTLTAGALGAVVVSFTIMNPIPAGGAVLVDFPAGFDTSGATGLAATSLAGLDGSWLAVASGQGVMVAQLGGSATPPGPKSFTIGGIRNPTATGPTGPYTIVTATPGAVIIDLNQAVPASVIGPSVQPPSITSATPPNGVVGASYSFLFTAAGYPAASISAAGALPPGLSLLTGGLLSGTPTQAGTYSFVIKADNDVTPAATQAVTLTIAQPLSATLLRVANADAVSGGTVSVRVEVISQGTENALGFSLSFDTSLLTFQQAVKGSAVVGGSFLANTNQAGAGRLGFQIAQPIARAFATGTQEVAVLSFSVRAVGSPTNTAILFGDDPVPREIVDKDVNVLSATYLYGVVTVSAVVPPPPPALTNAKLIGATFTVSTLTQTGLNYVLEYKNSLSDPNWLAAQNTAGTGGAITLTDTAATGNSRFYRLRIQ